jgi:hypothetical protein
VNTAASVLLKIPGQHERATSDPGWLLRATLLLFLLRVVAQVEVWLIAPDWLPPMEAWYSGLLPYPLLLPVQIVLLMLMAAVAYDRASSRPRVARRADRLNTGLRILAIVYFLVMVLRLALTIRTHGPEFYLHGAIPVAFHWVLALFLLALARGGGSGGSDDAAAMGRTVWRRGRRSVAAPLE